MAKLYVQAFPPADLNKNTEWFMYPGVWTTYILILFFSWLLVLSVFGCTPGTAWTVVNLFHFGVTASLSLATYHRFLATAAICACGCPFAAKFVTGGGGFVDLNSSPCCL
jgi:hypothetical protein